MLSLDAPTLLRYAFDLTNAETILLTARKRLRPIKGREKAPKRSIRRKSALDSKINMV
jgi:hypothetical protein